MEKAQTDDWEEGKGKMYLHYLRKYSYKICQFLASRRKENKTIYS